MNRANSHRRAARIALIYLLLGGLWIFASDQVLLSIFPGLSEEALTVYQTSKGLVFIVVTTFVLYILSLRNTRMQDEILKQLNSTDRLYNELLVNSPVGVYRVNPQGIPVHLNAQARELLRLGTTPLTAKWFDQIHPQDRQRIREAWQTALDTKTRFHQEYRIGGDPLSPMWLVDTAHCQLNEEGDFVGYLGTLTDITDLRVTQMAERELQERLHATIAAAHVGLWDMNIQTNEIWFSPEWKRQLGYTDEDMENSFREWQTRLHPADAEDAMRALQFFIRYPETDLYSEYRMRHKNGSYRWVLSQARMQFEDDRPIRILGSHTDITRLKEDESRLRESRERINHLLEASPTVLYAMRVDRDRLYPSWVSESVHRLLGFTTGEVLQSRWWIDHLHPDDRGRAQKILERLLEAGSARHEYRFYDKQGNIRWIRDSLRLIKDGEGIPREVIGTWMDFTEQHHEEQRLQLYTTAFNSISDGILTIGTDMVILSCNKAASQIFGYSEEELIGSKPSLFNSGRHPSSYFANMMRVLNTIGSWRGEVWNRHKDGSIRPQWLSISTTHGENGTDDHYVAVYTDISELKEKEAELIRQAHYDALTGLPSRLLLTTRLSQAIEDAKRDQTRLAVLFMDLDDFRSVNDSMGHTLGDELLIAVAHRLSSRTRAEDTLARLGGDDFALLAKRLYKEEDAERVARDMLAILADPFALSNSMEVYVEACIGIAVYPDNGETVEELMRNADTAMYKAKGEGRNNYCFHADEMTAAVAGQLELETALRQALELGQLFLQYQPKADIHSGRMVGAEALIRWDLPGQGLVPPDRFIPIAERSGLITPIGEWVLRTVCQQIRTWLDMGLNPINIALNVSARQFRTSPLHSMIEETLSEFDLPPEVLCLEITESTLMDNPEEASNVLRNIKNIGVKIALDDFGTGYSNMVYLSHFALDVLKIDGSFIRAIDTTGQSANLVDSIIDIARNIHVKTVAEGVETREQLDYLRTHNCDEVQGFYLSRPLDAADFTRWLQEPPLLPTADE